MGGTGVRYSLLVVPLDKLPPALTDCGGVGGLDVGAGPVYKGEHLNKSNSDQWPIHWIYVVATLHKCMMKNKNNVTKNISVKCSDHDYTHNHLERHVILSTERST